MKVIIQIPCYNEAETLPLTVAELPAAIPGVDQLEVLIVDDGSTDGTAEIARSAGVDHVVVHRGNRGLAAAFRTGIDACLRLGADIIVNTDGDNQYSGADIARLVEPILAAEADMVIGDRQTASLTHFSPLKRRLQAIGSFVVRKMSNTEIPDAVSGFRAFSREAALRINVVSSFSYTIETLIQAGRGRMAITSVPIETNGATRQSRLFRSLPQFLGKSAATMLRVYTMYQPLRAFLYVSLLLMGLGSLPVIRFLYFYFTDGGGGHVQSLVMGGVLLMMGFVTLVAGTVADLVSCNRQLIEQTLEKVRELQSTDAAATGSPPDLSEPALREELSEPVQS